jgi:hypothetical protein
VKNINITEQLNKFKNLINAKSGEVISEQVNNINADIESVKKEMAKGALVNTDEQKVVDVLKKYTKDKTTFQNFLNQYKTITGTELTDLLPNHFQSATDKVEITDLNSALSKIGLKFEVGVSPDRSRYVASFKGLNTPASTDPMTREQLWKTTFICATQQPGAKAYRLKDGTTAYNVGGIFYYNNGRKKLADGTVANYSCSTEFKTNSGTPQRKSESLAQKFAKSTQSLGIQNGKMEVGTLQKILAYLEGPAAKPKTINDFLPQGIPNDVNPNELQGETPPTVVAPDYEGIQQFVIK